MNFKLLKRNTYLKWISGVVGAVLIGAIGSGVWESILKQLFTSTRDLMLNVVSLGVKSYKDAAYAEIAKGFHESPSLELQTLSITLFICLLAAFAAVAYFWMKELEKRQRKLIQNIEKDIKQIDDPSSQQEKTLKDFKKSLRVLHKRATSMPLRRVKVVWFILVVLIVTLSSFLIVDINKTRYVNSAVTHFHQLYAITAPYVEESKRREVASSFARIKSREDYVQVIQNLKILAEQNGQSVPAFDVW